MAKYLDYTGLTQYDKKLKDYISGIVGEGYAVADENVNIKNYIDSRIFVGTAADVELALQDKRIDNTTFTMVVDPDATEVTSISDSEITSLFN